MFSTSAVLLACLSIPAFAAEPPLLAGAVRVDITPPLPTPYNLGVTEIAHSVGHPLYARVLYLERDGERALIVATDWEGVLRTAHFQVRSAIAAATELPVERIVLNASHSHNSLWINLDAEELLAAHGLHLVNRAAFDAAVEKIAAAAKEAVAHAEPATLAIAAVELPELAHNRRERYVRPEDREAFNRRRKYPIGVTDPTLGLVRVDRADSRPLAVLHVYASHATVPAGAGVLSGSYPGTAMTQVERELGGDCVALFLQGCAGNITPGNHDFGPPSIEAVERAGAVFAERALEGLRGPMKPIDADDLRFARRGVRLPLDPLRTHGSLAALQGEFDAAVSDFLRRQAAGEEASHSQIIALADRLTLAKNLDAWSDYEVQALAVGPLCLVFIPGESFVDFALEIRERSPFAYTFVSAYNDCTPVYIPDPIAFEEGGYEVGPWCYSTPETGRVLVQAAVDLVEELAGQTFVPAEQSRQN